MVSILDESILTMAEAAKRLPGRPHLSTLWRWRTRGIGGVCLETALYGGRRVTSIEALERFFEKTTAAADGNPAPTRTHRQRTAAVNRAERELDRDGI